MNIMLPEKFTRYDKTHTKKVAFIENDILYLKSDVQFKDLMKQLTYVIYGRKICYCCCKEFPEYQLSIDHIIPQDLGGPTITNNLLPLCRDCNNDKANMLPEQFEMYRTLQEHKEKVHFVKQCQRENEGFKYDKQFTLISEFDVVMFPVKKIRGYEEGIVHSKNQSSKEKKKQRNRQIHYEKYGRFQKAIVIDRKYHLLGGYESLMYAKKKGLKEVQVIILDNVEVIY